MATLPPDDPYWPVEPLNEVIEHLWVGSGILAPAVAFDMGFETLVHVARVTREHVEIPPDAMFLVWPFDDDPEVLPSSRTLRALVAFVAAQVGSARQTLVCCGAGLNRSALVAGLVLRELGHDGETAVRLLREARGPRALHNELFERAVREG